MMLGHPDDSWAEVELFRWQYGELPNSADTRKLNRALALEAVAKAIDEGCASGDFTKMPTPMNMSIILNYCARRIS